jgi:hypothetical protein
METNKVFDRNNSLVYVSSNNDKRSQITKLVHQNHDFFSVNSYFLVHLPVHFDKDFLIALVSFELGSKLLGTGFPLDYKWSRVMLRVSFYFGTITAIPFEFCFLLLSSVL